MSGDGWWSGSIASAGAACPARAAEPLILQRTGSPNEAGADRRHVPLWGIEVELKYRPLAGALLVLWISQGREDPLESTFNLMRCPGLSRSSGSSRGARCRDKRLSCQATLFGWPRDCHEEGPLPVRAQDSGAPELPFAQAAPGLQRIPKPPSRRGLILGAGDKIEVDVYGLTLPEQALFQCAVALLHVVRDAKSGVG